MSIKQFYPDPGDLIVIQKAYFTYNKWGVGAGGQINKRGRVNNIV